MADAATPDTGATGATGDASSGATGGAAATDKSGEQSTLLGEGAKGSAAEAGAKGTDGAEGKGDSSKTGEEGGSTEVPESYTFTAPEGVELDADASTEFSALAKDLKLSAADAQRVADIAITMAQRQEAAFATTVKGWETASRADAEFGGDALEENLALAQGALDTYGSPALIETLKTFGFLNHPEVIRAFYKIGKATKSDGFVKSGAGDSTNVPLAKRMYPNQN